MEQLSLLLTQLFDIFPNFEHFIGFQRCDWRTDVPTEHLYAILQLFDNIDLYSVVLYIYINSQEGMIVTFHNRYLYNMFLHLIYDIQYYLSIFMR